MPTSTNSDYWRKREAEAKEDYIAKEEDYKKELAKIYLNQYDAVEKEINNFYTKYASDNGMTMAEAKKRASKMDIDAYSRKAEKYVKENDMSERAQEEMRLYNMTMKVNRLELLKSNIALEVVNGGDVLDTKMGSYLNERTLAEIDRQAGIMGETIKNNTKLANSIVNASFHNATYSDRIWAHQDQLRNELNTLLSNALIQGLNPRDLARNVRKKFDVSSANAERLMRTELARVQIDAQQQSYSRNGVEEYEYIALGSGACDICRALDGKNFKVDKMLSGDNAPPMHPNCRCSTAPYINSQEYEGWLNYLDSGGSSLGWNSMNDKQKNKYIVNAKKVSAKEFKKTLDNAKNNVNPSKSWRVDNEGHSLDELSIFDCYITEGGSTFVVTSEGDIIRVSKNDNDYVSGKRLLADAVEKGGVKLDRYEGNDYFYRRCGFERVSYTKWNDEYAPNDWKKKYKREDIVFYKYTGKKTGLNYDNNMKELETFKNNFKPLDYDDAYKLRDESIKGG